MVAVIESVESASKTRIGMSLADFMNITDNEGRIELINGEIIPVSPTKFFHTLIVHILRDTLNAYVLAHGLGVVFIESPFAMSDTPGWVKGSRIPDVMFISAERYATYKAETLHWQDNPLLLVPDLVAEIVSPTDLPADVLSKAALYLKDGVKVVWIVDQAERCVHIYRDSSLTPITVTTSESLSGGDLLPGFAMPVATLFDVG